MGRDSQRSHTTHYPEPEDRHPGPNDGSRVYTRFVAFCLRWQYVSLVASLGITAVVVTFALTHIPFVLFHEFESTQFFINIETPVTSKLADTQEVITRTEQVVMETLSSIELRSLAANVGLIFLDVNRIVRGSNGGQLIVTGLYV